MADTQHFEIKVALLGYVSVGKSTVLNALLGKMFSEVSMKRTTAGVNYFRIANPNDGSEMNSDNGDGQDAEKRSSEDEEGQPHQETEQETTETQDLQTQAIDTELPQIQDPDDAVKVMEESDQGSGTKSAQPTNKAPAPQAPDQTQLKNGNVQQDQVGDDDGDDGDDDEVVVIDMDVGEQPSSAEPAKAGNSIRSAISVLEEIEQDNERLRASNTVVEKEFNIKLDRPLFPMRESTNLVLVDIPGLNEAGTSSIYKEYVKDKWPTFDCAIVVMDALQGVNTDEQVNILEFAKENNTNYKDIPIIIVANKVDDPEDKEHLELIREVQTKAEQIFGHGCSDEALVQVKAAKAKGEHWTGDHSFSAFVPMSAMYAHIYRSASQLTMDQFKKLDMDLIDKLGHEEVGRFKWKKLAPDEKIVTAFRAIQDENAYVEHLHATNFDCFLSVFAYCLGTERVQAILIKKQMEVELQMLSPSDSLVLQLRQTQEKCVSLGVPGDIIKPIFWKLYNKCREASIKEFIAAPTPACFEATSAQLSRYGDLVDELGWTDERNEVVDAMKHLARHLLDILIDKYNEWNVRKWYKCSRSGGGSWILMNLSWESLSPNDWIIIADSVDLCSNDNRFIKYFGPEKATMNKIRFSMSRLCRVNMGFGPVSFECILEDSPTCYECDQSYCVHLRGKCGDCPNCLASIHNKMVDTICKAMEGTHRYGTTVPTDKNAYDCVVRLELPRSPTDPSHFGHLIWKYCRYSDPVDEISSTNIHTSKKRKLDTSY